MMKLGRLPPALLLLFLVFAGCGQPSTKDKITAQDDASFESWIGQRHAELTPADVQELNDARQQIRFQVMQQHPGMMSANFNAMVYSEINGLTRNELLLKSYALQLDRANTDLANYQPMLERFEKDKKRTGLTETQKAYVDESLDKLLRLKAARDADRERIMKRLAELKSVAPDAKP